MDSFIDKDCAMNVKRMTTPVYLDHAGAGQYLPEQIEASHKQLTESLFGNPHSRSASSKMTTDLVDQMRYRILEHIGSTTDDYTVIFTSGCTAALKLIAESLDWNSRCDYCETVRTTESSVQITLPNQITLDVPPRISPIKSQFLARPLIGPIFLYLMDNHTSVIGMRQYPLTSNASVLCLTPDEVDQFLQVQEQFQEENNRCRCTRLFVFPAQSNFCGRRYVSNRWVQAFHSLNWLVCLDAASFVSTSPYDLMEEKPDFFTISFYKIFGYPTGLGALLVRKETIGKEGVMKKRYFGGGTVKVAMNRRDYVMYREDLREQLEDGTIPYQQILALKHGFDAVRRKGLLQAMNMEIPGGMQSISSHTFQLARSVYDALTTIKHSNGFPIAKIYCHDDFCNPTTQGPIVNFNLLRSDGSYVGYAEADQVAELYGIHWRTGCFCNQGACQIYLNLSDEMLMQNFESGKVCGDTKDLLDGLPVGSIRISFGWTSTVQDVQRFMRMIWECFVNDSPAVLPTRLQPFFYDTSEALYAVTNGNGQDGKTDRQIIFSSNESLMNSSQNKASNSSYPKGYSSIPRQDTTDFKGTFSSPGEASLSPRRTSFSPTKTSLSPRRTSRTASTSPKNFPPDPKQLTEEIFFDALDNTDLINGMNGHLDGSICLTDIFLYPVKSCGEYRTEEWTISERGLTYDRHWMILSEDGLCLNQKRESRLCLIRPDIGSDHLILRSDQSPESISIPLNTVDMDGGLSSSNGVSINGVLHCQSKVCADRVSAVDCGDEVGRWIDRVLEREGCRLVEQSDHIVRRKRDSNTKVSLANEEQYLLLHRPSVRHLLSAIDFITEDELISQFRPNLVVDGGEPFEEEQWKELICGDVKFEVCIRSLKCHVESHLERSPDYVVIWCVGKCTRCPMICIDQRTGERSADVLRALRHLRQNKTTFGIYLRAASSQTGRRIRTGQRVRVVLKSD